MNPESPQPVLMDIGGRRLAATFMGDGTPLVLLETGFGAESVAWLPVAQAVSQFTRVCYYDRAGLGGSDKAARPRSPGDLLEDVHKLLHSSDSLTPCVYVGQSFGGLMARMVAQRYPQDVAGMVLVDSMHVDQFEAIGPMLPQPFEGEPPTLASMRSFWTGGWRDASQNKEGIDMLACQAVGRSILSLGQIPLQVLTGSTFIYPQRMPPEVGRPLQDEWEKLQGQFAKLSSHATHQILPECGHFIQTDRPQAVIDAVAQVVAAVRGL